MKEKRKSKMDNHDLLINNTKYKIEEMNNYK